MEAFLLSHEAPLRLAAFVVVFAAMATWEVLAPRRALHERKALRWTNNLALALVNGLLVRAILPAAAVGVGAFAAERDIGLLHALAVPDAWAFATSVLVLDAAIYGQHVLFHAVPPLWRLHRVHHADLDFDVTTGVRFHPVEILLSMLIKAGVILVLGAPVAAVLSFEVILNATSMFNHGNVRVPATLDRVLRWMVVTPDMHRVHHSIDRRETDSNFGFNLPWWDRIFGTYRAQPQAGHETMTIGIEAFRASRELWLDRMLLQPLRSDRGASRVDPRGRTG